MIGRKNQAPSIFTAKYVGTCLGDTYEEQNVFAEDVGQMLPESACIKLGDFWYSLGFYRTLETAMTRIEKGSQAIVELTNDFLSEGKIPGLREINTLCYSLSASIKNLRTHLEAITLDSEGGNHG